MPRYHITWGTYGSWLPGDPRGFRTRHHRQHVDGDYRHPPPPGTYDGLHAHVRRNLKQPPVVIPHDLRETVGRGCLARFAEEGVAVAALSISGRHAHAAVACPSGGSNRWSAASRRSRRTVFATACPAASGRGDAGPSAFAMHRTGGT